MKNRFYVYSYSTEKDGVFYVGKGKSYEKLYTGSCRKP